MPNTPESQNKPKVTIYTDGGAEPNPGPGGWGAVLLFEKDGTIHQKDLKGGALQTTNNKMELTAALEALKTLKQRYSIDLFTDSEYLKKGISEWMENWKKTNFKNGKILNSDLWRLLDEEVARHEIRWHWVKGHASSQYNERADTLATMGRAEILGKPVSADLLNPRRVFLAASISAGIGFWAALLEKDSEQTALSGQEPSTTNNRLVLLAAIAALEAVAENEPVQLSTSSDYLREGINVWVKNWKRNGWLTQEGNEVKNRDLWQKLDHLVQTRTIKWSAISGDSDMPQLMLLSNLLKQASVVRKNQA